VQENASSKTTQFSLSPRRPGELRGKGLETSHSLLLTGGAEDQSAWKGAE